MDKKFTSLRRKGEIPPGSENCEGDSSPVSRDSLLPKRRAEARIARKNPAPSTAAASPEEASAEEEAIEEVLLPLEIHAAHPIKVSETRILVVHDAAASYRLVEETFHNFTTARVDSTADILHAFEMAILRDYQLFIIALQLPEMSGTFFYELVSRAYKSGLGNRKLAPAVVFVREAGDPLPPEEVMRDVRVKAVWSKPLNIERMLDSVSTVVTRKGL